MEKQNITLSIRKELLQKIKITAVKRNTSVSALISQVLEDIIIQEEGYQHAKQSHLGLLQTGIDLGTQGKINWDRDQLHDR